MPAVCLGAGTGAIMSFEALYPMSDSRGSIRSEVFALLTIVLELPATLLLYALLSRVAGDVGRDRLARDFRRIPMAIVVLIGGAFALFVASRWLRPLSESVAVMTGCAIYGAATFAAAAWATGALLRLAGALVTHREAPCVARPGTGTSARMGCA
jgi:hypothetical protein